ncbi:helix-turn-helix domain-containing protein [Paenibacillaceae bacterium]|nr:helix-turn-helix domain-containing protein [Paenibacillaceae bacterium]
MTKEDFNLIRLQEAMDILHISRATIDRWRKQKQLPHIKIGKEIWIDKRKLQSWIDLHAHTEGLRPSLETAGPFHTASSPDTITIGYQSGAALLWSPLIIKQLGLFDEELRRVRPRARINWVNAPNGMELVEALIAGRVDIASVGDYPIMASKALSQLLPRFQPQVLAFDGKTSGNGGISLVVPANSAARHATDLSSLTISTVGGSSASYRLDEWTHAFRDAPDPIVHRRMGDCLNGIVAGNVGASVLWEPYLSWVQHIGAGVAIHSEESGSDYLTGLMADGNWIRGNEDVVTAYLKAHLRAHQFIRNQPLEAAELVHQASGFPLTIVSKVLSKIRWDASVYSKDLQTLGCFDAPAASDSPIAPKGGGASRLTLNKQYLQEAAEALKLPVLPDFPLPGDWSSERENYY